MAHTRPNQRQCGRSEWWCTWSFNHRCHLKTNLKLLKMSQLSVTASPWVSRTQTQENCALTENTNTHRDCDNMPIALCPDCRHFLLRSLNKFPKARATLEELKHHPWLLWSTSELSRSSTIWLSLHAFLSQQKCPRKTNSWNVNKDFLL